MSKPTPEVLETLGSSSLVKYYNAMASLVRSVGIEASDVRRFADKTTAVKRCVQMQRLVEGQEELTLPELSSAEEPAETGIVPEQLRQDTLAQQRDAMSAVRKTHQPEEESDMAAAKKMARKTAPRKTEDGLRGFPEDAKIKILVKENPRRGAAAKRFEIYENGMTVADYTKKICTLGDALVHLRWDVKHGHISVE